MTGHNSLGYGATSTINSSGALIRQKPDQMSAPTIDSYSDTDVSLSWSTLSAPNNGDSAITSYELYWDNGLGGTPAISLLNSLTTSHTEAGLTAGTTY